MHEVRLEDPLTSSRLDTSMKLLFNKYLKAGARHHRFERCRPDRWLVRRPTILITQFINMNFADGLQQQKKTSMIVRTKLSVVRQIPTVGISPSSLRFALGNWITPVTEFKCTILIANTVNACSRDDLLLLSPEEMTR